MWYLIVSTPDLCPHSYLPSAFQICSYKTDCMLDSSYHELYNTSYDGTHMALSLDTILLPVLLLMLNHFMKKLLSQWMDLLNMSVRFRWENL